MFRRLLHPGRSAPPAQAAGNARADPSDRATSLYRAMKGGVWGVGTDREAILNVLEGLNETEAQEVKRHYEAHYGRDLFNDLDAELSKKDEAWAHEALRGSPTKMAAAALACELKRHSPHKDIVFRLLEQACDSDSGAAVVSSYHVEAGRSLLEDLEKKLTCAEFHRARALLEGKRQEADTIQLSVLLDSGCSSAGEARALLGLLSRYGPAIDDSYSKRTWTPLSQAIDQKLSGTVRSEALALVEADPVKAGARMLRLGLEDKGSSLPRLASVLWNRSEADRAAITSAYREVFRVDLAADLQQHLSPELASLAAELLRAGRLGLVEHLRWAILAKDATSALSLLETLSPAERRDLADRYRGAVQRELVTDLREPFRGPVRRELELMFSPGADTAEGTPSQEVCDQYARLRQGRLNAPGRLVMDRLLLSRQGPQLDRSVERLREAAESPVVSPEEQETLLGYVQDDLETYTAARERVATEASIAGAMAATTAVSIVTGGAGLPLVGSALTSVLTGAAGRTLAHAAIEGRSFTSEQLKQDVALGVALGAGSFLSGLAIDAVVPALGKLLLPPITEQATAEAQDLATRLAYEWELQSMLPGRAAALALEQGVRSGTALGVTSAVRDAFDPTIWEEGKARGAMRLVEHGGKSFALGFVCGAAAGGVSALLGASPSIHPLTDEEKARLTTTVTIDTPKGPQQIQLVGMAPDEMKADIKLALQQMSDETDGVAVYKLESIYAFPMDDFSGWSWGGESFALDSGFSRNIGPTVFHETGHNLTPLKAFVSGPWNHGVRVSDYAETSRFEDLAETHRVLMADWDSIVADPKLLTSNEGVYPKMRWLLENVYPRSWDEIQKAG